MPLTPDQILEIQRIIELHHYAFIANNLGYDSLPDEVISELQDKGLLTEESKDLIKQSYQYGQSLARVDDPKAHNMSFSQFQKYNQTNPMPLTPIEQNAIKMAQINAGQYCRGLGNLIEKDTGRVLIEADRDLRIAFEDEIKTSTARNIANRETVEKLKSDLGWATGDWARDLKRIAVTEIGYATQQGQADYLRKKYGADELVAKIPNPGACKDCLRLHIGDDGQPRIFKLSYLENNSNVGKRASDWQAVVGPVHPNCVCNMIRVPKGWGFDKDGELVPGGKLGELYTEPEELEEALKENDLQKSEYKLQDEYSFQGIPIAIETKEGQVRKWIKSDGETGETVMYGADYGYVKNSTSMDEEELDVFVGPDKESQVVYIITQKDPDTDLYDEQKCMLGFSNKDQAIGIYCSNYNNPADYVCEISQMAIDAFKRWVGIGINRGEMGKSINTTAANRSPAASAGVNYYIPVPKKQKPKTNKTNRWEATELLSDIDHSTALYGDKEDYMFQESIIPVKKLVIPKHVNEGKKAARKDKDKEKKKLEDELKRRAGNINEMP